VRRFDAEYLRRTREGMWEDRSALAGLDLSNRERVLDVGCGTGELTRVLDEETPGSVVGLDADPALLSVARGGRPENDERDDPDGGGEDGGDGREDDAGESPRPVVAGDATRLPFADGAFDLVVCQALLINLPDPPAALAEFRRVSSDLVAAIEPDNAAVTVDSTVPEESELAARARRAYLDGVETDVTLGATGDLMREAGLDRVRTRRYDHTRVVEPPYSERALRSARKKATGTGLAEDRETMLAGSTTEREYDELRTAWRSMGRSVVAAIADGEYRREETVPFFVTVGRVPR
jgi:SAM-dependent methyltransferase